MSSNSKNYSGFLNGQMFWAFAQFLPGFQYLENIFDLAILWFAQAWKISF